MKKIKKKLRNSLKKTKKKPRDRRRFRRFDCAVDVEYKLPREKKDIVTTTTKNVSRDGVSLLAPKRIRKGAKLDIRFDVPSDMVPFFVRGKVVRISKSLSKKTHFFNIGIKFLSIDPFNISQLLDYAYGQWIDRMKPQLTPPRNKLENSLR